jgi:hypothetical protein
MGLITRKPRVLLDANGAEIDPAAIYVAIGAFCAGSNGEHVCRRGTRIRGEHEAVKAAPALFLPDGASETEIFEACNRAWPDGWA